MPRGHRARAANKQEMMDMDEPAAPEPVEPVVEPDAANKKKMSVRMNMFIPSHKFDRFFFFSSLIGNKEVEDEKKEREKKKSTCAVQHAKK
jgi:hypothetical protein